MIYLKGKNGEIATIESERIANTLISQGFIEMTKSEIEDYITKQNELENTMLAVNQNQAKIIELKKWFDVYYTQQEQKLRRLITLNKLCDDNSKPQDKILALYNEAEIKRKQIQELEG